MSKQNETTAQSTSEDAVAAEQLVRDNIAWMLALAERMLRDRGLAEDAVQEAFISALTGMAHHWSTLAAEKSEAALKHHVSLVDRVYRLLDGRLQQRQYLADEYSIADIAAYPWIAVSDWTTLNLADYPNLERWYEKVGRRPAVARGMELPAIE